MAVNRFWVNSNKNKSDVPKDYVDKKLINLAATISTKASKSGEILLVTLIWVQIK